MSVVDQPGANWSAYQTFFQTVTDVLLSCSQKGLSRAFDSMLGLRHASAPAHSPVVFSLLLATTCFAAWKKPESTRTRERASFNLASHRLR